MKRITITAAALLLLMMITTIATGRDAAALIQNPTIPVERFDALNAIVQEPYLTWTSDDSNIGYSKHRSLASNDWMDWSEDGCSVPSELIPYRTKFYYGCLRHDFMWRTMAVLDRATGRVWNERNRFVADQMFLTDHQIYCALDYRDNPNGAKNAICQRMADTYHLGVRTGAGFRTDLTDSERDSVTYGHDDYLSGLVLAPAANCGLRSNRCLPINYLEYEGKPLVPKGLASIPQGVVLEMQLVRANQYAVKGPPVNRIITDPFDDDGARREKSGSVPTLPSWLAKCRL